MSIWMWEYKGDKTDMPTHIIFNNGSGEQTKNLEYQNGKCYDFNGVNNSISIPTGINGINANAAKKMIKVYTLNGECVGVKCYSLIFFIRILCQCNRMKIT